MSYKHEYFVEKININNINKTIKNYISQYKMKFKDLNSSVELIQV